MVCARASLLDVTHVRRSHLPHVWSLKRPPTLLINIVMIITIDIIMSTIIIVIILIHIVIIIAFTTIGLN